MRRGPPLGARHRSPGGQGLTAVADLLGLDLTVVVRQVTACRLAAVDLGASSGRVMLGTRRRRRPGPDRGPPLLERPGAARAAPCTGTSSTSTARSSRPSCGGRGGRDRHRLLGGRLRPARPRRRAARQPGPLPRRPHRRRDGAGPGAGRPPTSSTRSPACSSCRSTPSTSWPPRACAGAGATMLLMIPDLLAYWLTGEVGAERDERLHHAAVRRPRARTGATSWPRGSTYLSWIAAAAAGAR